MLQETPVKRRTPLASPQLPRPAVAVAATGSNDSSTATLTPAPSVISAKHTLAVTTRNGITTNTTTLPALRTKRGGKYSPVAGDAYSCDPLQRRSTEIIL